MASLRTLAAQAFFVGVVAVQAYFVVAAYDNPHAHFGYQPFNESSTWEARIYRVLPDGRRIDVREDWSGYQWPEVIGGERGLGWPFDRHHASYGVESTLTFFQAALDYAALHTPNDPDTLYLEAEVTYVRNQHPPEQRTLRSVERSP